MGGAGMTLAMVDSSSGAASRLGDKPGDDIRRRRQDEHSAHDAIDLVQPELEAGCHAKVAAAAADCPEQVRVRLGVRPQELAIGGHDLGGQQVVDGQTVLADEIPNAAAQGDPSDPHRAGVAEPGRQTVVAAAAVYSPAVSPVSAQAVRRSASICSARISLRSSTMPPSADTVTGIAVAAAAHGQLHSGLASERDDMRDICHVRRPDDHSRAAVEPAVEDRARVLIPGVVWCNHLTFNLGTELGDRNLTLSR